MTKPTANELLTANLFIQVLPNPAEYKYAFTTMQWNEMKKCYK